MRAASYGRFLYFFFSLSLVRRVAGDAFIRLTAGRLLTCVYRAADALSGVSPVAASGLMRRTESPKNTLVMMRLSLPGHEGGAEAWAGTGTSQCESQLRIRTGILYITLGCWDGASLCQRDSVFFLCVLGVNKS